MIKRHSTDVINSDFDLPEYKSWTSRIGISPALRHCKFWEQMMIYDALKKHGALQKGKRGLGFGVGNEQLVSVFASEGAEVVATDQAITDESIAWDNGQLAHGKKSLFYKDIIDSQSFNDRVTFENHDMNQYNKEYREKFDFLWSNCVIGHLGSMQKSERYLKNHAKYLGYGGISVITTEMTISSLTETVDRDSGTIIWRLSDLLRVFNTMLDSDMVADRFKLRLRGDSSDDHIFYDIEDSGYPTSTSVPVTKIPFSNYAITAIQIVFKKQKLSERKKRFLRSVYQLDYQSNRKKLHRYINSKGDIADYTVKYTDNKLGINPLKRSFNIILAPGEKKTYNVKFINQSDKRFFSYGLHTPLTVPPLVLSTADPVNRVSRLKDHSWFSDNRPAVAFTAYYDKSFFKNWCHGYHRVLPGESFSYQLAIVAPLTIGKFSEAFCLVLEGEGDIPDSKFTVNITVKKNL